MLKEVTKAPNHRIVAPDRLPRLRDVEYVEDRDSQRSGTEDKDKESRNKGQRVEDKVWKHVGRHDCPPV